MRRERHAEVLRRPPLSVEHDSTAGGDSGLEGSLGEDQHTVLGFAHADNPWPGRSQEVTQLPNRLRLSV